MHYTQVEGIRIRIFLKLACWVAYNGSDDIDCSVQWHGSECLYSVA